MCEMSSNPEFSETQDVAARKSAEDMLDALAEVFGTYKVLSKLAEHGQGIVYLAFDSHLNRQVIIKVSRHKVDASRLPSIVEEGRALARLDHPNIATIYQLNLDCSDRPFLVMENIDGRNLAEQLKERQVSPRKAASLVIVLANAMQHAHDLGVVHNDLKPANVVIRRDGTPKIIDFGLAKIIGAFEFEKGSSSFGGTIAYMSPEQACVISKFLSRTAITPCAVDERADVFSLGAILYELLTGERLYKYSDASEGLEMAAECQIDFAQLNALTISTSLKKACCKALEKKPINRFSSANEFAHALELTEFCLARYNKFAVSIIVLIFATGIWALTKGDFFGDPRPENVAEQALAQQNENISERPRDDQSGILGFGGRIYFSHFSNGDGKAYESLGELFENGPVYEHDDLRITAILKSPMFCFLFAVNPNGRLQLFFPESDVELQDLRVDVIDFPRDSDLAFRFTDGPGQQTFVLLLSSDPLPSFKEWLSIRGMNNRNFDFRGNWTWSRGRLRTIRRDGLRGDVRPLRSSGDFVSFCEEVESTGLVVTAVTFPVLSRSK